MNGRRGGPTIVRVHSSPMSGGGIQCCCFQCCTCLNLRFLQTQPGLLKIAECILGAICQSLVVNYGFSYAATVGPAFYGFLTTVAANLLTSCLLFICYVFSTNSFGLIRQSLFEMAFNGVAAFTYISSSSYLAFAVKTFLYPLYMIQPRFEVFPALSAAYMIGTVVGIIHAYDAYQAYRYYRGYR